MQRSRIAPLVLLFMVIGARTAGALVAYPVPWPRAGGGIIVAVPLQDTKVDVYHLKGVPHNSVYDKPLPMTPETTFDPAPAGKPIFLYAPAVGATPNVDEDDFFVIASGSQLVLSIADDERLQAGSPDRFFFMPSDTGTFRGKTFYGESNGGDPLERFRIMDVSGVGGNAEVFAWIGSAWVSQGMANVPAGGAVQFDPSVPATAYKVVSDQSSIVLVGYMEDNATAPAVDRDTGRTIGKTLLGYGTAWHLRAIDDISYTVETRPEGSSTWTTVKTGTLAADASAMASGLAQGYVRITLTGGVGWGITGTDSLADKTEWDGFFLPAQAHDACLLGAKFFTHGSARTISVLPAVGTTVTIRDEATGTVLDTHTSTAPWEFHNYFHPSKARVEFTGGAGAVLLVGTLNFGDCTEATNPANCGILEGGYSISGIGGFDCAGEDFGNCGNGNGMLPTSCTAESLPVVDAGPITPDDLASPDLASGVIGHPRGSACACQLGGAPAPLPPFVALALVGGAALIMTRRGRG